MRTADYREAGLTGSGRRRVRSAERVAAVLDLLARSSEPLRHGEVARTLGLPKSSASDLLDTLAEVGLIARGEGGYSLGMKLIELGAAAADRLDLAAVARPVLRELSELGIGTANLAILHGHEVLYVEKLNNLDHVIQIDTRVGGTAPAHATALGKVLVAALNTDAQQLWMEQHDFVALTEHTITSKAEFEQAVRVCTQQGYALDEEEQNLRTVCVAAPIKNHSGATIAAISLTCLSVDVLPGRALQISAVTRGAGRVSKLLGGLDSR